MKFATIALFLGTISAQEFNEELINEIKIQISPAGQKEIAKEAKDVKMTLKKIEHSRPVRNLEASLKRWAATKEIHELQAVDKAFIHSKEGQRLIKEWKDVGRVLKKNLHHDKKTGTLYLDNKHVDELSDELDDVEDQYKSLDGSKWDKAYEAAWKKALATKQFESVKRRATAFKGSNEGKMLHKEVVDLKKSIKKNLKITDLPEESDSSDDEEDVEELTNLLKITISKQGQAEVKKEAKDVKISMHKLKQTAVFKKLEMRLKQWVATKEVAHIAELDKKFMASPEGKKLVKEWHDFGEALKKNVKPIPNGIKIDNKALLGEVAKEAKDVDNHIKSLKGSKWDNQLKAAFKSAFETKEAQNVQKMIPALKQSAEAKALHKEIKELMDSLKKNVKATDVPKEFKKGPQSLGEEDEEDEFDFLAKKKAIAKKAAKKPVKKAAKKADTSSSDEEDFVAKKAAKKSASKKAAKKDDSDSSDDEEILNFGEEDNLFLF